MRGKGGCVGELESVVKLRLFSLNPGVKRFSSTISSFECVLCSKTVIAWNSQPQANMYGAFKGLRKII